MEVVASDILDHLTAPLSNRAIGENNMDADDLVTYSPIAQSPRTGGCGGNDSTDGSSRSKQRVECEPLAGMSQG